MPPAVRLVEETEGKEKQKKEADESGIRTHALSDHG